MKKIFDKASLHGYLRGVELNEKFDTIIIIVVILLSLMLHWDILHYKTYLNILCVVVALKTFLILNTKAKLKLYCKEFNRFYNGESE